MISEYLNNGGSTGVAFLLVVVFLSLRYLVMAGGAWGFFWKTGWFRHRRIQAREPKSSVVRGEIIYSFFTFLIFALMITGVLVASRAGYTQIYTDFNEYGTGYFLFSLAVFIVVHDAYFYWAHRFMHIPAVYKRVHAVHHRSVNPTPWASFAFHPLEAVVEALILPIMVFTIPLHPLAIFSFALFMTFFNVLGHLGFEVYGRWFMRGPFRYLLNSSTHHNQHHKRFRCNYGLYFNWWDRLMGTNHQNYETELAKNTAGKSAAGIRIAPQTKSGTRAHHDSRDITLA